MFGNFLPYRVPASDPSYGGGQTKPGPGLPGGPGPVPRPGPRREGASVGVARGAPEIGEKMGEAASPDRGTGGDHGEGRAGSDRFCLTRFDGDPRQNRQFGEVRSLR